MTVGPFYRFDLVCPRCNRTSQTTSDKRIPPPHVNCGNCLMDRVEIVEMKVVNVVIDRRVADSTTEKYDVTIDGATLATLLQAFHDGKI